MENKTAIEAMKPYQEDFNKRMSESSEYLNVKT